MQGVTNFYGKDYYIPHVDMFREGLVFYSYAENYYFSPVDVFDAGWVFCVFIAKIYDIPLVNMLAHVSDSKTATLPG